MTTIDSHRWPPSIRQEIQNQFDVALEPYRPLYIRLKKNKATIQLTDEEQTQCQTFLARVRNFHVANEFLCQMPQIQQRQLQSFQGQVDAFVDQFCDVLSVINHSDNVDLIREIDFSPRLKTFCNNALCTHTKKLISSTNADTRYVFSNDLSGNWPWIVKELFKEADYRFKSDHDMSSKIHPLFRPIIDQALINQFNRLYKTFTGQESAIDTQVKKYQKALQTQGYPLQFASSPNKRKEAVTQYKTLLCEYKTALLTQKKQWVDFVHWFATHQIALNTLDKYFDRLNDNPNTHDLAFANSVKNVLDALVQQSLSIDEVSPEPQKKGLVEWQKNYFKPFLACGKTLMAAINTRKDTPNSVITDISNYVSCRQEGKQSLLAFKTLIEAIGDPIIKTVWLDVYTPLKEKYITLCKQSYRGQVSIEAWQEYSVLLNEKKQALSDAVNNRIKTILLPMATIQKNQLVFIESIEQNNIEALHQAISNLRILDNPVKETFFKHIQQVFPTVKALSAKDQKKALFDALDSTEPSKQIPMLNTLVAKGVEKKSQAWGVLSKELEFLQWMDRFAVIVKKLDAINPELTGQYKVTLNQLQGKGVREQFNQAVARLKPQGQYERVKKVIDLKFKEKLPTFDDLSDALIDEFLTFTNTCYKQKNKIAQQLNTVEEIDAQDIQQYMRKMIIEPINHATQLIHDGKFQAFSSEFNVIQQNASPVFQSIQDYLKEMKELNHAMGELEDRYDALQPEVKINDQALKTRLKKKLDDLYRKKQFFMKQGFNGQTTVNSINALKEEAIKEKADIENLLKRYMPAVKKRLQELNTYVNQEEVIHSITPKKLRYILNEKMSKFVLHYFHSKKTALNESLNDMRSVHFNNNKKNASFQHIQVINNVHHELEFFDFCLFCHILHFYQQAILFNQVSKRMDYFNPKKGNFDTELSDLKTINKKNIKKLSENYLNILLKLKQKTNENNKQQTSLLFAITDLFKNLNECATAAEQLPEFFSKIDFWERNVFYDKTLKSEWEALLENRPIEFHQNKPDKLAAKIFTEISEYTQAFRKGNFDEFSKNCDTLIKKYDTVLFSDRFNTMFKVALKTMERKETFHTQLEKMKNEANKKKRVVLFMQSLHQFIRQEDTVDDALEAFAKTYKNTNFLITLLENIPDVYRFKAFWDIAIGEDYLKAYLTRSQAIECLESAIQHQASDFVTHLFSLTDPTVLKKVNLFTLAKHQPADVFLKQWETLTESEQNSMALQQLSNNQNRLTISNIVLQYQSPAVFLTVWKSLSQQTKRQLLTDKKYLSNNERWSVMQVAILMLPKPAFNTWLSDIQTSLKLTSAQWTDLLIGKKDNQACCVLDIAGSYRLDLLFELIKKTGIKENKLKTIWLNASPLIQAITINTQKSSDYSLNVAYKGMSTKDAFGNTRLFREAFAGNTAVLRVGLACFPANENKNLLDTINDTMLTGFWKLLAVVDRFFTLHTFQNALEYRKGALLRMAIRGGDLNAVQLIVKRLPYDLEAAFSLATLSINRLGFERARPILNALINAQSNRSWLNPSFKMQLAKLGYCIDFESEPTYPEVKPLKEGGLFARRLSVTPQQTNRATISLGESKHILMKKPKLNSTKQLFFCKFKSYPSCFIDK